ncbi:acid-sensing ion channel 1A-like isoform X2 [Convolutriloba macropyga]|uniref:acid-sensing ion channel 1A-like isoform X2 n=1 Tax=Convolutriloba macropyga TaxID=536237 RepID=UPI003F5282B8
MAQKRNNVWCETQLKDPTNKKQQNNYDSTVYKNGSAFTSDLNQRYDSSPHLPETNGSVSTTSPVSHHPQCPNMGNTSSTAKACCYGLTAPKAEVAEHKDENSTLKNILLFIIICISFGMLIYTSKMVVCEFLAEPIAVETTLKNETDPMRKFPEIIICSHRMASLEKMQEENMNMSSGIEDLAAEFLEKIKKGEDVPEATRFLAMLGFLRSFLPLDFFDKRGVNMDKVYNDILWHSTKLSFLPAEKLKAIKISRDEFIIDCQIKDYVHYEMLDCLPYMEDIVTNEYAVCQRISLPVHLRETATLFPGATYGLRMNLFLNTKDTSGEISAASGVRVTIYDPEYPVIPQNSGVDVTPGIALSLAFRRFEYTKINRKSHNFECVYDRDWNSIMPPSINKTMKGFKYASTDYMLCDQTCTSIYLQATCNCSSMHYFGDTICKGDFLMNCVGRNYKALRDKIKHCRETMCQPSCKRVDYRVTTNQAMFPSEAFLPLYIGRILSNESSVSPYIKKHVRQLVSDSGGVNNKTMDILRREFVHLHIYSESSDTTLIEEKNIYTEWSLLSNIGGNMGMFLGLSIVGFFKIAIRLKNRIGAAFRHYFENRRKKCRSILLKSLDNADT